jgi:cell division protein FtsB
VLATAVAATLALAAPQAFAQAKGAASKAEIQAIQAQMQALAERLNKLEASNTQLQTENQQLKSDVERRDAEIDYLKAQTKDLREEGAVASNEISKVKGADWASRIKFKGDFRFRDENISQERVVAPGEVRDAANQNRARLRVRAGLEAKVTDNTNFVMQLATGGSDPRSSNVTLDNEASRKDIGLDLARGEIEGREAAVRAAAGGDHELPLRERAATLVLEREGDRVSEHLSLHSGD